MSHSSEVTIQIAEADFVVEFSYKVTAKAHPAAGPTYSSGGEPASPMEYEVNIISLREDKGASSPLLPILSWLYRVIERYLLESDMVYEAIEEMEREDHFDEE